MIGKLVVKVTFNGNRGRYQFDILLNSQIAVGINLTGHINQPFENDPNAILDKYCFVASLFRLLLNIDIFLTCFCTIKINY